jgi:hypothetical protein
VGEFTADVEVAECKKIGNYVNGDYVSCANPTNLNEMALIDTAA